jgi:isopenicillin N synthase-like dioxygenase
MDRWVGNIPLVDFEDAASGDPEAMKAVARKVYDAAHERGFMYVKNVGLTDEMIEAAFAAHTDFFDLPEEEKLKVYYRNPADQHGYSGIGSQTLEAGKKPDMKESFISRNIPEKAKDLSLWPNEPFRDQSLTLFYQFQKASDLLLQAFALALDLPQNYFGSLHTGLGQSIRYLHYPPVADEDADLIGAGAHTDFGSLTLLLQDSVGGLEIQTQAGEWISAPPVPGALVINTGDLMNRWTNEVFRSTPHRVLVNRQSKPRRSVVFFSNPDPAVIIETIPSCITAERPQKYPAITAQEHILARVQATMHMDKIKTG